jgi:hypothetical protein
VFSADPDADASATWQDGRWQPGIPAMSAPEPVPPDEDANRQTASLAGVVVILVLILAGLLLVHVLRQQAAVEDCLLAGRMMCGMAHR